jgi:hypothetical protein
LWSGSYFAGSVDAPAISVVHQCIEQQNRPTFCPHARLPSRPA